MRVPRRWSLSPRAWAEILLSGLVLFLLLSGIRAGEGYGPLPAPDRLTHRVDVNEAPWHELVDLPGVGETRARAIVQDRRRRGPFAAPEDLDRVRGIGPRTVEKIRRFAGGD